MTEMDREFLRQLIKNQMTIMCFLLYGKEDARAKELLEKRIKKTREFLDANYSDE